MKELFSCSVCGEGFVSEDDLDKHLEIHGAANFHCYSSSAETMHNMYALASVVDENYNNTDGQSFEIVNPEVSSKVTNRCNDIELTNIHITDIIQSEAATDNKHSDEPNSNDNDRENCLRYVCCYCSKKCMTKWELTNHERTHTKERPYQCNACNKTFAHPAGLYKHKRTKYHNARKVIVIEHQSSPVTRDRKFYKYMCSYCAKGFKSSNSLKLHERIHTGEKPFQCSECQSSFRTRGCCFMHMRRVHKKEPALTRKRLIKVSNDKAGGTVGINNSEEENELVNTSMENNVQVDRFEDVSSTLGTVIFDENGEMLYKCPHCPKTWKRGNDLVRHVRYHTGEKPYMCPVQECAKSFYKSTDLKNHVQEFHDWESLKDKLGIKLTKPVQIYKCPHCSRTWNRQSDLVQHIRYHTGEKPYQCPACPNRFHVSRTLSDHVKNIHDWESLKDKVKKVLEEQVRHRKIVNIGLNKALTPIYRSDSKGKCVEKGSQKRIRRSRDNMNLVLHKFKCSFCSKRWRTKSDVRQHERIHTGEKPYQCSECNLSFRTRGSVYQHMRRLHNIEPMMKKAKILKISNNDEPTKECETDGNEVPTSEKIAQESEETHGNEIPTSTETQNTIAFEYYCSFCNTAPFSSYLELDEHERAHDMFNLLNSDFSSFSGTGNAVDKTMTPSWSGSASTSMVKCVENVFIKRVRRKLDSMNLALNKFKCSFCSKRWKRKCDVREHERIHTGEKPYQCPECNLSFRYRGGIHKHMRELHKIEPMMLKAKFLKIGNNDEPTNSKECETHGNEMPTSTETQNTIVFEYKCSFCNTAPFSSYLERDEHEKTHDICNRSNSDFSHYSGTVHAVDKTMTSSCSGSASMEKCVEKGSFKRVRRKRDTMNLALHKFKCSFCDKKWKCRSMRRAHEMIHTGDKPIQCSECEMTFRTRGSLCMHMKRIHKKEPMPMKENLLVLEVDSRLPGMAMDISEKDTSANTVMSCNDGQENKLPETEGNEKLISHGDSFEDVPSTSNSKCFQCPFCSKAWTQATDIILHVRYHTGLKPFKCPVCLKSFFEQHTLNLHIKDHHDWETYKDKCEQFREPQKCPFCPKMWIDQSQLIRHVKTCYYMDQRADKNKDTGKKGTKSMNKDGKERRHGSIVTLAKISAVDMKRSCRDVSFESNSNSNCRMILRSQRKNLKKVNELQPLVSLSEPKSQPSKQLDMAEGCGDNDDTLIRQDVIVNEEDNISCHYNEEPFPETKILKEPNVSVVNCEHTFDEDKRKDSRIVGNQSHSNSCSSTCQKVIKINNNGQVKLFTFTITPFDCTECVRGAAATTTCHNNPTYSGVSDETILDHSYTYSKYSPTSNTTNFNSNKDDHDFDMDLSHAMDIIAHSQDFLNQLPGIMTTDTLATQAVSDANTNKVSVENAVLIKTEPIEVVYPTNYASPRSQIAK